MKLNDLIRKLQDKANPQAPHVEIAAPVVLQPEPDELPDWWDVYTRMATIDWNKYHKIRNGDKANFINCWVQSMEEQLNRYKINKPQFADEWLQGITN